MDTKAVDVAEKENNPMKFQAYGKNGLLAGRFCHMPEKSIQLYESGCL
jgi:hypothetical protein